MSSGRISEVGRTHMSERCIRSHDRLGAGVSFQIVVLKKGVLLPTLAEIA